MATLVSFHAHPDDEAISVGGTAGQGSRRRSSGRGRVRHQGRARRGRRRRLDPGEALGSGGHGERTRGRDPRRAGVAFLGYVDSGMMGTPENDAPEGVLAGRHGGGRWALADILREEHADVLTVYDDHGGVRPPRPHPGAPGRGCGPPSWRARRGCTRPPQPRPHQAGDPRANEAGVEIPATSTERSIDELGVDREPHHHRRRRPARSSTGSGRPWPRTPARSPTRRSSSRMPAAVFVERVRHRVVHPPARRRGWPRTTAGLD